MLNLELLQELVAFQKYGTLSETARHLSITQPSITRGMKKLETDLGVKLFNRQKNKISLNATGLLAAKKAEQLLQEANDFSMQITNYAHAQQKIIIAAVLPDPLMVLQHSDFQLDFSTTVQQNLINPENVATDLREFKDTIIITTEDMNNDEFESLYLGKERLFLQVDQSNPLAKQKSVNFQQLKGTSFIVVKNMGPWKEFIQDHIPNAKLLCQNNVSSLVELTQYVRLPMFQTNLTMMIQSEKLGPLYKTRTNHPQIIPITDSDNYIELYGTYLKSSRKIIHPLLKRFAQFLNQSQSK